MAPDAVAVADPSDCPQVASDEEVMESASAVGSVMVTETVSVQLLLSVTEMR